jgi:transposase InsO family protein
MLAVATENEVVVVHPKGEQKPIAGSVENQGSVVDTYGGTIHVRLDRNLEDDLAIAALKMALTRRNPSQELTHHSDRCVQYASNDYTGLLKEHGIRISMSRSGNPL